jgi:hypothetical protein
VPDFDTTASAALDEEIIHDIWFAYLDVEDDPIRVTTAGYSITLTGTGDTDLDGHTFTAVDPTVLDISEVTHREGGSETVYATLSGILELDADVLNAIGDRTKWQGRVARLWMGVRNADGSFAGALVPYYTGYMMLPEIQLSPEQQVISMAIENYLALLNAPSNRSYLSQDRYDPADQSAKATLGAVNGASTGPGAAVVSPVSPLDVRELDRIENNMDR